MKLNPLYCSQLHALKQGPLYGILHDGAAKHGLAFALVLAIGSRETNLVNKKGDFRDGKYHGYGILQGDIQHGFVQGQAATGRWKSHPEELVGFCLGLLAADLAWARRTYPQFTDRQHLKIAAAAYNSGPDNAARGVAEGDADAHDTGHDYGANVLTKYDQFAALLAGG